MSYSFKLTDELAEQMEMKLCVCCQEEPEELISGDASVVHIACTCASNKGSLMCLPCAVKLLRRQSVRTGGTPGERGSEWEEPPICPACRQPWQVWQYTLIRETCWFKTAARGQCVYSTPRIPNVFA
eukprot:SAG25_NODE_1408_length_3100_cov_1.806065_4_plen_127_part_00